MSDPRLKTIRVDHPAKKAPDKRPVYFIQAADGLIKIGVAASPEDRLNLLQPMSPLPLRLRLVLPGGGAQYEAELHERFRKHRSHGEWFRPAPELIRFMNSRRADAPAAPPHAPPVSRPAPRPTFTLGRNGERIRLLRTARSVSVTAFAERVSITRQHMSNVELGRSAPSLDLLVRIASELGVSVDYLLGRDEPPSAKAA